MKSNIISFKTDKRLAKLGFVCQEPDPSNEDGRETLTFYHHWTLILKDDDDTKVPGDIKIVVSTWRVEKAVYPRGADRSEFVLPKWRKVEEGCNAWMVRGEDGNEIDLTTPTHSDIETLVRLVTPRTN